MLTMQDFLLLLVVVLQLMILNFLMEMDRAVRHRATADNNEQRAVRPEFITNVETRRRRENENHNFLDLLVVVLLLVILYLLMEMDRAVRHRVTANNNEQRAVRPEFFRNVQGRRRRDNENHCVPPNGNRPTENDERQG